MKIFNEIYKIEERKEIEIKDIENLNYYDIERNEIFHIENFEEYSNLIIKIIDKDDEEKSIKILMIDLMIDDYIIDIISINQLKNLIINQYY